MKNFYELTYILNPVLEEDDLKKEISEIEKLITDNDGVIDTSDEWGIRQLVYDIDGKGSGYFVNLYMDAPGAVIEKLERHFKISDHVVRFLTLKYDNKMKRHYQLAKKGEAPSVKDLDPEVEGEDGDDKDDN